MDNSTGLETTTDQPEKKVKPIRVLKKPAKRPENTRNSSVSGQQIENNFDQPQGSVESLTLTSATDVLSDFVRDSPLV